MSAGDRRTAKRSSSTAPASSADMSLERSRLPVEHRSHSGTRLATDEDDVADPPATRRGYAASRQETLSVNTSPCREHIAEPFLIASAPSMKQVLNAATKVA